MTAKYEMEFSDGGTAGGLKKISDAHKDAAATGQDMAQKTGKATEQIHKEGEAAAKTTTYLENLRKSYAVTTNDVDKYSSRSSDSLNRATTSLHAFGTGVGPLQAVGKAAQTTAEGLGKLGGTAAYLGDKDMLAATQGLNAFAGGLAATSTPLGALMAIIASGIVVMKELNKTTVEGANSTNIFDKAVIDFLDTLYSGKNTVKGMVDEINKLNAEGDKFVAKFASGMDDMSKRVRKSFEDIKAISDDYAKNRSDYELRVKVSGIEDVKILEQQSKAAIERLEEMAKRVPEDFEQRERFQQELEAETEKVRRETAIYEARRQQILDEQRTAAIKAADEKKKADADDAKRAKEESDKEIARIEAEKEARIKASNERRANEKKADEEKQTRLDEYLKKASEPAAIEPAQPSTSPIETPSAQPNKYGEGEAPTAGQDSSAAFADAVNPLGQFSTDFNIGGNSYTETSMNPNGGGGDKAAKKQVINEAVEEQLKQFEAEFAKNMASKYDVEGDVSTVQEVIDAVKQTGRKVDFKDDVNQFNREQRGLKKTETQSYRKALAGKDTGEDASVQADRQGELVDASQQLLDETKQANSERTDLTKEHIGITKELAQQMKDTRAENAVLKNDLAAIKAIMGQAAQNAQRIRGAGAGSTPSNDTSRRRSSP